MMSLGGTIFRPIRVLIIHTTYQHKGGEDSVVLNEIKLLKDAGVVTSLLQFSNTGRTISKLIQAAFNYGSYKQTAARVKSFKPDIVHVHNLHFGASPSVLYALKKFKIPFVITLHNYRLLCPSATLYFNGEQFDDAVSKAFSWAAVFKGVYQQSRLLTFWVSCSMLLHYKLGTHKLASKYIALGTHTKEIFAGSKLSAIASDIFIKPNFCYSDGEPALSVGQYYLYVGRLSEEKGVRTLLTAFAENGLPLKIAGGGDMVNEVITHSRKFSNIEFVGSVNQAGVSKLLNNAIALIFPSQWFETFGMVIIEAFAKGVPVIASDLGQLRFTIKNKFNGLHFNAGDAADLSKVIKFYQALSKEEKLAYQKNAYKTYQDLYTPETNLSQLLEIYYSAINKHTGNAA